MSPYAGHGKLLGVVVVGGKRRRAVFWQAGGSRRLLELDEARKGCVVECGVELGNASAGVRGPGLARAERELGVAHARVICASSGVCPRRPQKELPAGRGLQGALRSNKGEAAVWVDRGFFPGLSLLFHDNPVVVEGAPCCSFRLHVRAPAHHSCFETTIGCSHVMVAPASQSVGGRLFPLARSIDVPPCRYYLSGQAAEAGDAGRVVCCVPWRSRALPMV